jgi:hypothetical protein
MFLERLFDTISMVIPGASLSDDEWRALSALDPEKIYVENVRSVLGVSHQAAVRICETAVRQGLFQKRVEVMCADGTVVASAGTDEELPSMVHCWREEDGNIEEVEVPTSSLDKTRFYRLNEDSAIQHYS